MNAYMNISVRVISANARSQIKALQAQVAALEGQLASANARSSDPNGITGSRNRKSMMAFGNQIQWSGRMLQYNFTLPLVLAGAAATKFALENEKAMTRVAKVYGDADAATRYFEKNQHLIPEGMNATTAAAEAQKNELEALGNAFTALSTKYGVAQKEVLETAGAWAAAGSSGRDLAMSTELSLEAAVLGEMELAKATEALIAIQAQYSLSTDELSLTLAHLNAIENQTGISMQGLIDGFGRSAGVAREAGIDVRHLGAMLAALVPATGSAATAGNALKTIISRLMSPTGEAARVMKEFGVNTADAAWQSSTATERLQILANHMSNTLEKTGQATKDTADDMYELSDSQKSVVASTLGSRYQMNRFLVLMREMAPGMTYYEKALEATANKQKSFQIATDELNAVLDSSPKRLEIMWVTLQNGMATAIQPLIPYIIYLAQSVGELMTKFNGLNPEVQKLAIIAVLALAAVGPFVRYMGALLTLVGALILPLKFLAARWVALMTVQKMVNGVMVATRVSLIGLAASIIAMPFSFLATGFGAILATGMRFTRWLLALGPVTAVASAGMAAGMTAMSRVVAVGLAAMRGMHVLFWATVGAGNARGLAFLVRGWVASLAFMTLGVSRFARITAVFSGIWTAIAVLFSRQLFMPLIMGMAMLTTRLGWVVTSGIVAVKAAFAAAWYAILLALVPFRGGLFGIWVGIHTTLAAMTARGGALIVAAWRATTAAVAVAVAAGGALWSRVYMAAHVAMAAFSVTFWRKVLAVMGAAMAAMPRIIAVASRGMTTAWAMVVSAVRTGALAAAAAAAAPWVLGAAAIIAIIVLFKDQLAALWNSIVAYFSDSSNAAVAVVIKAWNMLPQGVANALTAVVTMVRDAALQVYEWFSYINPFARHSPSLVENVTAGMAIVGDQFGIASRTIKGHAQAAYKDIKVFGNAVRNLLNGADSFAQAKQRATIAEFAPSALKSYDALSNRLRTLAPILASLESSMASQQSVVDSWTAKVERANEALEAQQGKLDRLIEKQGKWQESLAAAEARLDSFADSPIAGMGAMSDAIFENEMAQKRLRLEMMRMEETSGTLDDVKSRIEAINGAQEMLRGEQSAMRSAGAGSDILSYYDDQIAALEATKRQQSDTAGAIANLSSELDELARQGEMLDLQNSLQFDPLTRQIDAAANAIEELPFDVIMAGVAKSNAEIAQFAPKVAAATAAVDRQRAVVDTLTSARDAHQTRLDAEEKKLESLKSKYDEIADAIRAVEEAMQSATGAADAMARAQDEKKKKGGEGAVSPAVQNFRDAAGGNFANVGGEGIPMREDWSDQSALIDEYTKQITDDASRAFGDLNPFEPIKRRWGQFQSWAKEKFTALKASSSDIFAGAGDSVGIDFGGALDKAKAAWGGAKDWFKTNVVDPIGVVFSFLGPSLGETARNVWNGIKDAWGLIKPELAKLWTEIKKLGPAFRGFWNVVKVVLAPLIAMLALVGKIVVNVFAKTIRPLLKAIGGVIANVIQIFRGALQVVSGFFMMFTKGNFLEGLKKMGAGVLNIFSGMFGAVGRVIQGAVGVVIGIFWGIVDGIIDAALWLYNVMVGNSIIPDLINAIWSWFKKLISLAQWVWNNVAVPVINFFKALFTHIINGVKLWWAGIQAAWAMLKTAGQWIWDNVLSPVLGWFVWLWESGIKPALLWWWEGIKSAWANLLGLGQWVWDNVLSPVLGWFVWLWENGIKPAIARWWNGIKNIWAVLKGLGRWVWNNVLKPVLDFAVSLGTRVINGFKNWWERIKSAWSMLKTAGAWIKTNVMDPVKAKIDLVWEGIKGGFRRWWSGITNIWNGLKKLGGWFGDNVMDPIKEKITGVWGSIKTWFEKNKDIFTKPVKGIVNVVIDAVNAIIKGLNKVSDILPGVDWQIDPIVRLAQGGEIPRQAGRGFKTNGARAIVGEGKANYPEFVIPTDPTYRNRAKGLLALAASKIGVTPGVNTMGALGDRGIDMARVAKENPSAASAAVPQFAKGGWLGKAWDGVKGGTKGLVKEIAKLPQRAVGATMDPLLDAARSKVKEKVSWKPIQSPPLFGIDKLEGWVKRTDTNLDKRVTDAKDEVSGGPKARKALEWAKSQAGKPYVWGGVGPDGYDCSGYMSAIANVLQDRSPHSRIGTTGTFPWPGWEKGASPEGFTIGSTKSFAGGVGHMSGTLAKTNVESRGGIGTLVGAAARGYNHPNYTAQYHMPLKEGGIALARKGPTLAAIGDGRYDEAVVPLPKGWRSDPIGGSSGDRIININGDLVLPNIKSGADAKEFLDNLENLAED